MRARTWLLMCSQWGWWAAGAICQGAVDIWLPELLKIQKLEDLLSHGERSLQVCWPDLDKNQETESASSSPQLLYLWGIKMLLSPPSLLWMFIWPIGQEKKEENWVPDKGWVFLLGNKPETFWLKKEAVVKAIPALHEKEPFPPCSFPRAFLGWSWARSEQESWTSKAAWTGTWVHSWTLRDLSGKQPNSALFFCIFFFNSVAIPFQKCITKAPPKTGCGVMPLLMLPEWFLRC